MCKLCGKALDSIDHALCNYVKIKLGWYSCLFFSSLVSFRASDFLDRCLWVFSTVKADWTSFFLATAWCAWNYRNLLVHGGSSDIPNFWVRAETFLRNFILTSFSPKMPSAPSQRSQVLRPPDSGFKVNVDVALDKSRGIFSLGVVARDRLGKPLWVGVKCFNGSIEAKTTKTLAILEGVHLAISENLNPVIVESNAINAINLWSGSSLSRSKWTILFKMSMILLGRVPTISLCVSRPDPVI
ncbi:hypothetical protein Q3G72_029069 [Acer saccharum]|nr:hypothetical protein Q3G72_029069 [Acer saccharum]